MLNDLFSIAQGLAAGHIPIHGRHPDVSKSGKGAVLRVRLQADGRIASLEILPDAGEAGLWTIRDGNHNGFPVLKTTAGLLEFDVEARRLHKDLWEKDKSAASRLTEVIRLAEDLPLRNQGALWPNAGHRRRITERLATLALLSDDPMTAAVPAAFVRFLAALDGTPGFLGDLKQVLTHLARLRGGAWVDQAQAAFIGPILLAIDVASGALKPEFTRDATDPGQIGPVSESIGAPAPARERTATAHGRCAMSGDVALLHVGNSPKPILPGIGLTYLYSRNSDIKSLTRYGLTADASFPIAANLMQRLAATIEYLTAVDKRGRTWRLIPAEAGDGRDLMVVSFLDPDARAADALVESGPAGEEALGQLASRVLAHADGRRSHEAPETDLSILILRAVDPGNRKAIYSRTLTASALFDAARGWEAATSNAPEEIRHRVWIETDGRKLLVPCTPFRVSPLSIVSASKIHYVSDGRRRVPINGVTAAEALSLFLGVGDVRRLARRTLALLLRRHTVLLAAIGGRTWRGGGSLGNAALDSFDPRHDLRADALRSLGWICVLLHRLGVTREIYMVGVGYRLGQLLAAADIVHVGYCADMRGGVVPMTLIGNSVFSIAGARPNQALAILQGRWKPYGAWANRHRRRLTERIDAAIAKASPLRKKAKALDKADPEVKKLYKDANEIDAAAWIMKKALDQIDKIQNLVPMIANELSDIAVDDIFKAELLLGYLSGPAPADGI